MIPGQYILAKEDIVCNGNKKDNESQSNKSGR